MAISEQFAKIKDNWLIIALVLVVLLASNFGSFSLRSIGSFSPTAMSESYGGQRVADMAYSKSAGMGIYPPVPIYNGDFAPGEDNRKITKSSSMANEVETGTFKEAESKLKSIIKISNSYLLNENVNKYESGRKEYFVGSYSLKIDTKKYNDVISQLKAIGEVKSFNENAEDITASYKNVQIEINVAKERLDRYKKMYDEATLVADKIQLSDRILDQERTIKYMEDSLKNIDQQVDYSSIYFTLTEKRPALADAVFVKLSDLIKNLVDSINSLLRLIFIAVPYAVAVAIVWVAVRFFRGRKVTKK